MFLNGPDLPKNTDEFRKALSQSLMIIMRTFIGPGTTTGQLLRQLFTNYLNHPLYIPTTLDEWNSFHLDNLDNDGYNISTIVALLNNPEISKSTDIKVSDARTTLIKLLQLNQGTSSDSLVSPNLLIGINGDEYSILSTTDNSIIPGPNMDGFSRDENTMFIIIPHWLLFTIIQASVELNAQASSYDWLLSYKTTENTNNLNTKEKEYLDIFLSHVGSMPPVQKVEYLFNWLNVLDDPEINRGNFIRELVKEGLIPSRNDFLLSADKRALYIKKIMTRDYGELSMKFLELKDSLELLKTGEATRDKLSISFQNIRSLYKHLFINKTFRVDQETEDNEYFMGVRIESFAPRLRENNQSVDFTNAIKKLLNEKINNIVGNFDTLPENEIITLLEEIIQIFEIFEQLFISGMTISEWLTPEILESLKGQLNIFLLSRIILQIEVSRPGTKLRKQGMFEDSYIEYIEGASQWIDYIYQIENNTGIEVNRGRTEFIKKDNTYSQARDYILLGLRELGVEILSSYLDNLINKS